ncbi:TetR family regulatory protein [Alcanivorax sp. MD8A]|uniref:TetR/AcrR family transcriptional regulator n=1 Tax=Alcanivorax profundi TaxID=2338368 RepID=A0A418XW76_9GAMM|nr:MULTISPECIES: TetR/AcrR family transcriptional regulator [Alcanivorax]ERP91859.1 hypothetical protein Q670_11140 [Alcanivorax sp. P2S70]PNE02966.1 TetR family regulatory protein [Alcanivorax sp. MD8A]RJG17072.1 TetR/AcrR family transcriptional regulator [Alcanivorax profundi]
MRRQPKQRRSREMVDRILEAAAATLVERGLEYTTTNHIADQAGVNIASLYHYFTNKEEIVAAVLEWQARKLMEGFTRQQVELDLARLPLPVLVQTALMFTLQTLRADPVVRELAKHWNQLSPQYAMSLLEQQLLDIAMTWFRANYRDYPLEDLHVRLFVLINSSMATLARYLATPPSMVMVKDAQIVAVMTDMIVKTLTPEGEG